MVTIKPAKIEDCPAIMEMIIELAAFETLPEPVTATVHDIENLLFTEKIGRAFIAKWDDHPAGFCLFFYNLSTVKGKKGIYLEDIYVRPAFRGNGIATWMLQLLGRTAHEEGCGRLDWACLDWNQKAQDFYLAMGAKKLPEWQLFRVDGPDLAQFGMPKCVCSRKCDEEH